MKIGWQLKPLVELCEFTRGLTYSKGDEVATSGSIVLRATNIDLGTSRLDLRDLRYISESVEVPRSKTVRRNSLLICTASGSKNHLGKVAFIDRDYGYAFGGFMGMITPSSALVPRYLFHLMTSPLYSGFIDQLADGANINNLKYDDLRGFHVPFPPFNEQQRIVALLDEAFAAIATAKANAEKNLQNARALFDSYLANCFSVWHDTWPKETIGSVCEYSNGKAHEMHIDEGGQFILINSKFISSDGQVFKRTSAPLSLLRIGDVAMVLSDVPNGKALAKCYLVESNETYSLNQRICSFRSKMLIPRFLYWQLNRHPYLLNFDNGENQTNLRLNQVLSCPLVVPPLHVQQSLADTLDSIAEKVEALKEIFEGKLAALDELKKSLLHRAFNGDL